MGSEASIPSVLADPATACPGPLPVAAVPTGALRLTTIFPVASNPAGISPDPRNTMPASICRGNPAAAAIVTSRSQASGRAPFFLSIAISPH